MTHARFTKLMRTHISILLCAFIIIGVTSSVVAQNDDENTNTQTSSNDNIFISSFTGKKIYKYVENKPIFPGCEKLPEIAREQCTDKLLKTYINDHITYPQEAQDAGIEGVVYGTFVVNKDGKVEDVNIARGIHDAIDSEVRAALSSLTTVEKKWTPARYENEIVNYYYILPVKFELAHEAPKEIDTVEKIDTFLLSEVSVPPFFPGCNTGNLKERAKCSGTNFSKFIFKAIEYPEEAIRAYKGGTATIAVIITHEGEIGDVALINDPGYGLGQETLRVIESMNTLNMKWSPARKDGKPVNVIYMYSMSYETSHSH